MALIAYAAARRLIPMITTPLPPREGLTSNLSHSTSKEDL
jgi:hypothetical protein